MNIVEQYESGKSATKISKETGVSLYNVLKHLKHEGVNVYNKQNEVKWKVNDFVDLYAKLTETCSTVISSNKRYNSIWNNQDIRSINQTTQTISSVNNIILNIMPKYVYHDNCVTFNYASVGQVIKYKVTDAGYDFAYSSLSSSDRDKNICPV